MRIVIRLEDDDNDRLSNDEEVKIPLYPRSYENLSEVIVVRKHNDETRVIRQ